MKLKQLPYIAIAAGFVFTGLSTHVQAATFRFDPAAQTFGAACTQTITLYADATGESSNAADLEVDYNPTLVKIVDADPNVDGVQITTGNAYEAYFANQVNETTGTIKLAAGSFIGNLTSRKVFASITFTALPNTTQISFTVNFSGVGATLDSNIADTSSSTDLLTAVTNGLYTFDLNNTECSSDNTKPVISFVDPTPFGQTSSNQVVLSVSDSGSGVDISTVEITINGTTYTATSPNVTFTGDSSYLFTITDLDLPTDQMSVISTRAKDLSGNNVRSQSAFNVPSEQSLCPVQTNDDAKVCSNLNIANLGSSPIGIAGIIISLLFLLIIVIILIRRRKRNQISE